MLVLAGLHRSACDRVFYARMYGCMHASAERHACMHSYVDACMHPLARGRRAISLAVFL